MATFGRKTGSLKKLKETLAKGGGNGFAKYIPKNGSINVRFIQEPEEWVSYVEHFDEVLKTSFPCSGEKDCPGCISGARKSGRYLANAVNLDDKDQVIALQLPKTLANSLVVKYEKWGSLTDRDIELSKSGDGLDTIYDIDYSQVDRKSIAKYVPKDLMKVLEDMYDAVFGDGADDDDDAPPPRTRRSSTANAGSRSRRKPAADDEDEDDTPTDDDDEDEAPKSSRRPTAARGVRAGRATQRPKAKVGDDEDDEDEKPVTRRSRPKSAQQEEDEDEKPAPRSRRSKPEPEPEPEEDDDEETELVEYDEDDLGKMTLGEVRSIARDYGIKTAGKDQDTLIDEIMDAPPF